MSYFLPSFGRLVVLLITLAVAALCVGLGQIVGARRPATALVAGWGFACIGFVVPGSLFGGQLHTMAVILALVGITGLGVMVQGTFEEGTWATTGRVLALAIPFLLIASATGPAGTDEFSHWLPNLDYLYRHDRFPSRDIPSLLSERPGVPYAIAYVGYCVSLLLGHVAETAGIVWNTLLMIAVAALCADILTEQLRARQSTRARPKDLDSVEEWGVAGIGLLAATMLSPSFAPRFFLSNSSDGAVGSVTGVATAAIVLWLTVETSKTRDERLLLVASVGFACAALAQLRQDGLTLFALMFVAAVAATPLERQLRRRVTPAMLLLMMPPALLVALVWREYQVVQIPDDTLAILSVSDWHWAALPVTLWSMVVIGLSKIGYFALLAILVGFAVVIVDAPQLFTPFQRTGVAMGAVLGLGKIISLVLLYLVSDYTPAEAASAKDFWQYMIQIGPALAVAAIALIPQRLWSAEPAGRLLCIAAPVLAVILPLVSVRYLRVDLPHASRTLYLRDVGREIAEQIGAAPQITLVDPDDPTGDLANLIVVRYQLQALGNRRPRDGFWPPAPAVSFIAGSTPFHVVADAGRPRDAGVGYSQDWRNKDIGTLLAAPYVWFQDGGQLATQLSGLKLPQGASYLVAHHGATAEVVRSWPFPP